MSVPTWNHPYHPINTTAVNIVMSGTVSPTAGINNARAEAEIYRFPSIETKWLRNSRQRDSGRATSCKQSFELEWIESKSV